MNPHIFSGCRQKWFPQNHFFRKRRKVFHPSPSKPSPSYKERLRPPHIWTPHSKPHYQQIRTLSSDFFLKMPLQKYSFHSAGPFSRRRSTDKVLPEDLLKFGLIPEFVGRLPMVVSLESLDQNALINILSQPKNALVKQYSKLFELDNVELEFTEDALKAIADEAINRKTGARGLRAIVEETMMDIMFDIPSEENIVKATITEETIKDRKDPELEKLPEGEVRPTLKTEKKNKARKDIETA